MKLVTVRLLLYTSSHTCWRFVLSLCDVKIYYSMCWTVSNSREKGMVYVFLYIWHVFAYSFCFRGWYSWSSWNLVYSSSLVCMNWWPPELIYRFTHYVIRTVYGLVETNNVRWQMLTLASAACMSSDRGNYLGCAGQNVIGGSSALCQTFLASVRHFFPVDDGQISLFILVFLVGHFMCIEFCWTKCPARSELSAGHQQKSAGHVRHISRLLHEYHNVYNKLSCFTN